MQASMESEMVRERLEELGEELQTVASLVHLSIKNQQHGVHESAGSFDCSGDAERKFQDLKGEVQTLARVLDSNSSSLASLTADSLADVNKLADQASRCKEAIGALDGLCQAEDFLNSSQSLLAKNEYVQAADAVACAEVLLGDLHRAEAASANRGGRSGGGVDKENRRNCSGTGGDSGVLRAVKRLLLKRRAALESHLRDLVQEALQLGPTTRCRKLFSGYLYDRYFRSAVPLVDVFEALGRLGQLDALFSEISEKLRKDVVAPLLSARHVPPPKRVSDADSASLTYAPAPASGGSAGGASASPGASGFLTKEGGGKEGGPGTVSELLGRVTVVLEFMHEEVLGGQAHLTSAFGLQLMSDPDGLSKILLNKLEDHIPHSAQQLPDFERAARDACYIFEDRLCEMGYYADDNAAPVNQQKAAVRGNLCRFVETVDGRFSAKRRRALLEQARDLALGDYHNTVEVSDALEGGASSDEASFEGVTSVKGSKMGVYNHDKDSNNTQAFRLEACQVSTVACSLVALVRATLAEACSDQIPPHCASQLFRTARDMLDLFRAVVPVQHANALDGVPRIAAVFQNDCLYLAHHMITLGHEFRHGLPPPANQTATMIDTVHLFRELAAHSFSEQRRRQQRQLQEFFIGVDVLASTEAAASSSSSSSSLHDATTSALDGMFPPGESENYPRERLDARGWTAASGGDATTVGYGGGGGGEGSAAVAVRKSVYHLRQLRQAWFKVLPDRVYKRAMGALLSLVAGKICTPVMGAKDLAEEQTHALHRIFKTLGEAAQDMFDSPPEAEQYTPGWSKAVVVGQMMELGLEAIGERLQGEGDGLRPLTNDELGGLIRAIFQDNAGRGAILDAITEV